MNINNKKFELFHASIVSFSPATMEIDNNIFEAEEGYIPFLRNQYLKPQSRELIIDFINEEDISNFTAEISKEAVLDLEDSFIYRCYLKGTPSVTEDGYHAYTVLYPLYVIKQAQDVVIKNERNFIGKGNIYAYAKLEITSAKNIKIFRINNYEIRNLKCYSLKGLSSS